MKNYSTMKKINMPKEAKSMKSSYKSSSKSKSSMKKNSKSKGY